MSKLLYKQAYAILKGKATPEDWQALVTNLGTPPKSLRGDLTILLAYARIAILHQQVESIPRELLERFLVDPELYHFNHPGQREDPLRDIRDAIAFQKTKGHSPQPKALLTEEVRAVLSNHELHFHAKATLIRDGLSILLTENQFDEVMLAHNDPQDVYYQDGSPFFEILDKTKDHLSIIQTLDQPRLLQQYEAFVAAYRRWTNAHPKSEFPLLEEFLTHLAKARIAQAIHAQRKSLVKG